MKKSDDIRGYLKNRILVLRKAGSAMIQGGREVPRIAGFPAV
jgi:hypothetical protein